MTKFLPSLFAVAILLAGCSDSDPAKQFCADSGGEVHPIENPMGDGPTLCYFEDNRLCEVNALLGGFCPVGGVKVTGFDSNQQTWCAALGGQVDMTANSCTFTNGAVCDIDQLSANSCDLHFNDTSWKYLPIPSADALIGVPLDLVSLDDSGDKPVLTFSSTDINDFPDEDNAPLGLTRDNIIREQANTVRGDFAQSFDFVVSGSTGMVALPHSIGKVETVMSRFEVCNVTFERTLTFFRNFHRVQITVKGNSDQIISENPDFFAKNENCGDDLAWNFAKSPDIQTEFWQALISGQLQGAAVGWLKAFDDIVANLQIAPDPNSY